MLTKCLLAPALLYRVQPLPIYKISMRIDAVKQGSGAADICTLTASASRETVNRAIVGANRCGCRVEHKM